jgi:hypothetical protein
MMCKYVSQRVGLTMWACWACFMSGETTKYTMLMWVYMKRPPCNILSLYTLMKGENIKTQGVSSVYYCVLE